MAAGEFPRSAAALNELVGESMPADPAKDELWVNFVNGLAEERADTALSADLRG
jgi:hypothetical protein